MAFHSFKLGRTCGCRRDRRDRERLDGGQRGDGWLRRWHGLRTRPDATAALEQARRGRARGGGHVHHQLCVDRGGVADLRRAVGCHRYRARSIPADHHRLVDADRAGADNQV